MKQYIKIKLITSIALCVTSCLGTDERELVSAFLPPQLTLDDAEIISNNVNVTFIGSYDLKGTSTSVDECGFYYGTNPELESAQKVKAASESDKFSVELPFTEHGTKYYYKAYVSNGKSEILTSAKSFQVPDFSFYVRLGAPSVVSSVAGDVTIMSSVDIANGLSVVEKGILYNSNKDDIQAKGSKVVSSAENDITVEIKSLSTGSKYYMCSYVSNGSNIAYSEVVEFTPHSVPTLTTSEISEISYFEAVSGGTDLSGNGWEITSKGLVWSTTPTPTIDLSTKTEDGKSSSAFTSKITGLSPGTKYYVRAYAVNEDGVGYGNELSFTTLSQSSATLTTVAPTEVTSSSATSGGNITSDGGANITARGVVWSTDHNPTISLSTKTTDGTGTGSFVSSITGLQPGTTYYVRAYATNSQGTSYGDEVSFTTKAVKPSVTTSEATGVTKSSATVGGNVTATGGADVTERGVVWSTSKNPTVDGNKKQSGSGSGAFIVELIDLKVATTYYVRAYATNSVGTSYGDEISFTTGSIKPTVTTTSPSDVTSSSATSGGNVTDDGGKDVTARGIVWSTDHNPTISLSTKTTDGTGTGSFVSSITGLQPGTTYYVRAYATNSEGTSYGDEVSFTTKAVKPSVTTSEATGVTKSSATVGGNVTTTGGADVTERGVVWSTSKNPTVDGNKKQSGSGSGNFTVELTDLEVATTYYVRAYATNSVGTSYGEEISFTTGSVKPTVTTVSPSDVTSSSATSGGNVTSDGGKDVTVRGVVWSTDHNPTISLSTKTTDGTGTGSFVSSITGLEPGATYYVRAYATNSEGTSYGDEVSFTTKAVKPSVTTSEATGVTKSSATVGGNVTATGGTDVTERGVVWSTSKNPTVDGNKKQSGSGSGNFTVELTDLEVATTYYVRAYAINSVGTSYGEEISFTTRSLLSAYLEPSINVDTYNSLVINVRVEHDENDQVNFGIVYDTNPSPDMSDNLFQSPSESIGGPCLMSGLTIGTTYYIRAYIYNITQHEAFVSEQEIVYTHRLPDIDVTTNNITSITSTTAKLAGNVTYEDYYSTSEGLGVSYSFNPVTDYGFVYGTSSNPTVSTASKVSLTSESVYEKTVSGLTPNTKYYVKTYATTVEGTTYGVEKTFTTEKAQGNTEGTENEGFEW